MYPSTNTWSGFTENITISDEATTIPTSPYPDLTQVLLDSTLQVFLGRSKKQFEENSSMLNDKFVKLI